MPEDEKKLEAEENITDEKITRLEEEIADLTGKWKRMAADYANLERRVAQEKEMVTKYANTLLLLKIFPILDNLEKAAASHPTDEGLAAIVRQSQTLLDSEGTTMIPALGEKFNPHFHECVDVVEGEEDDKVVAVLHKGYKIDDRVLRPAKVRVSKKQLKDGSTEAEEVGAKSGN